MAIDRDAIQKAADKLVRQGRLLAAAEQYTIILKHHPTDLVTINKIGDLLARAGRPEEAVRHFQKIADVYTSGGFFLKAIAIYKKILKLDATATESMLRLGDLYARQDLLREGREMYYTAAQQLDSRGERKRAREVYEKLMRLDPREAKTRVAYSELLEKAGEPDRAAEELAVAAGLLSEQGLRDESLALFRRALESAHGETGKAVGLVRSVLGSAGAEAAFPLAEQTWRHHTDSSEALDVLVEAGLRCRREAEVEAAVQEGLGRLEKPGPAALLVMGRIHGREGRSEECAGAASRAIDRLVIEERLSEARAAVEEMLGFVPGSVPLLEASVEVARMAGERDVAIRSLERLAEAHREAGREEEATQVLERLAGYAPEKSAAGTGPTAAARPAEAGARRGAAPAVPGGPGTGARTTVPPPPDDEFVLQHLAEADVLIRYGLKDRAVEQLGAVLERHPAHIAARRRLKDLHLAGGEKWLAIEQSLEIARSLSDQGDLTGALAELREAQQTDPASTAVQRLLAALAPPEAPPAAEEAEGEPAEIEISLVEEVEATAPPVPPAPAAAAKEEGLFDLSSEIAEDLARALGEMGPPETPPEEIQSLPEVLEAFRESVDREVGEEDHATHYELGIAYKEMGLLDEAISEFLVASRATERYVDSCNMLALCHREKGEPGEAEGWYRRALESLPGDGDGDDPDSKRRKAGLAYDLGDLLAGIGEWGRAREAFEEVRSSDRGYRDVEERLREAKERAGASGGGGSRGSRGRGGAGG